MSDHREEAGPSAVEFRETIGICTICGDWIHDDTPYLRRPTGYCHRECFERGPAESPEQQDDEPRRSC